MPTQLAITYTTSAATGQGDLLQIEQQAWAPYTGTVTRAEMVRYLAALVYGEDYQSRIDCGLAATGAVVCVIDVYPRIKDLVYRLHTSHGSLSEPSVELITEEEIVNFTLTQTASPSHPPCKIESVAWMGDCYNAEGAVVDSPRLSIEGETIVTEVPVYGAVTVRYRTERHRYVLNAPRRDQAIDNHFSAAVYGIYDGGISWIEIEMPPGIETFEADPDARCGWGSSASVTGPDGEPYPVSDGVHTRRTEVDYCGQVILEDEIS